MTLQERIEARQAALVAARALTEQITADTDEVRAAELGAQHDAAMADFDRHDAQITRLQNTRAAEQRLEDEERAAHNAANGGQRPAGTQGEGRGQEPEAEGGVSYADAFFGMMRHGGQLNMMDDEVRQALMGGHNAFTDEVRQQMTTPNTSGGFTVPTILQTQLEIAMAQNGPMWDGDIVDILQTENGVPMEYPTINDLDGELDALPEGTEVVYDAGKAFVFGQGALGAHMFDSKFIKLSRTLMQDSNQAMVQVVSDLLGERAGRTANKKLTTGTGVNEPQGIVVGSSLGHTSAAVGALAADDLIDHEHEVNAIYRGRPGTRWQMNDGTLKGIRKFKDANGNYMWSARDIKKGTPETLLGYGMSINPDMDDVATGNDPIIFGDHKKFIVRKVGNIIIGVASEKFWPNLGLAAIMRFDGRVKDARALKRMRIR